MPPPAIISIFVGEELEAVIDAIASDSPYAGPVKLKMDLGVDVLPKFSKDTTDRNRTSPFAFTGNKSEFRTVSYTHLDVYKRQEHELNFWAMVASPRSDL